MPVELSRHTETILCAAVEINDPGQRAAYLDQACGDDPVLRQDVQRLVDDHFRAGLFLERPGLPLPATMQLQSAESPGAQVGRYKLLEQIGEGGMGVVYVAEQTEPVRRRVALKIIKPGMDTRQVIARFEAERQALAMMDHPNIARVHDGGATDTGRPYFVMELVRGMPITDYCDQAKLNPRGRLELFMTVCHAVQHAHQKGIIHRDIKPTNVLVTMHDDKPVVKVIDFGVAKAVNHHLTERTIYTAFTEMIGTPLYMSPEQAQLSGLDVDTRSDVYSLGVLLYELLTGQTPFDRDTLVKAGLDEIRRMIREDEPQRPSHRISTMAALAGSTVSQKRGFDQRQLTRVLHGELDWIVMKALEKDRNCRYQSANDFAADIEHYLNNEPVEACPPSALYRFRKFARRRRGALVAISLVVTSLLAGVGLSLWQAAEANTARENAVSRLNVAHGILGLIREEIAGDLAKIPRASQLQRKILEESMKFYDQLLESDPDDSLIQFSRAVTAKALSKVYLSTLDDSLRAKGLALLKQAVSVQESLCKEDPANLQKLRQLGWSYQEYADYLELWPARHSESLLDLRTKYVDIFRRQASSEPQNERAKFEYAIALARLAYHWLDEYGRHPDERDPAKAASLTRQAIELVEGLRGGGVSKKDRMLCLAQCYMGLGQSVEASNNAVDAEQHYRKALDIRELLLKDEPKDALVRSTASDANEKLAKFLRGQGQLAEEEPFFRRAVELAEADLDEFPDSPLRMELVTKCVDRIVFFEDKSMWREAIAMYPHCLKHLRRLWEDHPQFATGWDYRYRCFAYANLLYELRDKDAAREAYRETLRVARRMLTLIPGGADNTVADTRIPFLLDQRQDSREAQNRDVKTWLAIIESTCPFPERCEHDRSQSKQTLADLKRSGELRPRSLRELKPWRVRAEFRLRTGDPRGALADFDMVNSTAAEIDPMRGGDPYWIVRQAICHDLLGEFDEGTKVYEKAASHRPDDSWTREVGMRQLFGLAGDLWKLGRHVEARRAWAAAIERTRISFESVPSDLVRFNLGVAHYRLGNFEASLQHFQESIDFLDRNDLAEHSGHGNSGHFYFLAMAHASLGHKEEAQKWFERGRQWDNQHASSLQPQDREANRAIREEAAKVLGISDEPEKTEVSATSAQSKD
jgi:serine/threonine protein kinase